MNDRYQRKGVSSNAQAGKDFENDAQRFFKSRKGLLLVPKFKMHVGVGEQKKEHAFDLGCGNPKVIVECKSHKWTESGNTPSAKMTQWNEAMYYFAIAPKGYQKIMFVLHDFHQRKSETLAAYYLRTYFHLVPDDVEFWEYDEKTACATQIREAKAGCRLRRC